MERFEQQLQFILEINRLKTIQRQVLIGNESRRENSAEHSWHVAMMAMLLCEHADEKVDAGKVVRMLLVHDIVEIDAGDAFTYDPTAMAAKEALEIKAADRLFNLLPADQAQQLRALWDEYEAQQTVEAHFAKAIDCLQPVLLNHLSAGHAWRKHGVKREQVLVRNAFVADIAPLFLEKVRALTEDAQKKSWLL